jgi:protein TonB
MREMAKYLGISLGFHLAALAAIPLLASTLLVKRPCPMVIDFTVNSCPATESRRKERTEKPAAVKRVALPSPPHVVVKQPVIPARQPARIAERTPTSPPAAQEISDSRARQSDGEVKEAATGTPGNTTGGSRTQQSEAVAGGATGSAESAKQRYLKEHFVYIRDLVARQLVYPAIARKMGWGGKAVVAFTVMEDGNAGNIRLVESSGVPILDRSALETVRKASPFPSPPVRAEIVLPVLFRLL